VSRLLSWLFGEESLKECFMARDNSTNVDAAFDILLEQIEAEIDLVNRAGAQAFESRDYEVARSTLERVGLLMAFRDRTVALRREWETLAVSQTDEAEGSEEQIQRRDLGRLRRGLRTPEQAYYRPILQVLVELGGRAQMGSILDRVGEVMEGVLREVDYQPLASDPDLPRWRNAAQFARYSMVQDGLLRNDSPRGIWEITDEGRRSVCG
jgi:restriction system protein